MLVTNKALTNGAFVCKAGVIHAGGLSLGFPWGMYPVYTAPEEKRALPGEVGLAACFIHPVCHSRWLVFLFV